MAGTDRPTAHDLTPASLEGIDLRRAGLFAVLRQLEARAAGKPRIGHAKRPDQSIVDLAQAPSLSFEAATFAGVEHKKGRPLLRGHWLGLMGPMGPLPTHLTEFALFERRNAKKRPFGDWLDLLAGRMLQLFYRAWAQSQPVAHADRPADDSFARWLGALSGAMEGANADSAFGPMARVHYAGLYSGLRSAGAIEDGLSHLLRQPVRVIEFMPRWRKLEREDLSRLGRSFNTLGSDAVLGDMVFSAADAFRVVVRAKSWRDYLSMLPGGARFMVAAEAIESFRPGHLEWDICLEVSEPDIPPVRLDGRARLGWTSWVKRPGQTPQASDQPIRNHRIRADAHLNQASMKKGKSAR